MDVPADIFEQQQGARYPKLDVVRVSDDRQCRPNTHNLTTSPFSSERRAALAVATASRACSGVPCSGERPSRTHWTK